MDNIVLNEGSCQTTQECLLDQYCDKGTCKFLGSKTIDAVLNISENIPKLLILTFGLNELVLIYFFIVGFKQVQKFKSKDRLINILTQPLYNKKLIEFLKEIYLLNNNTSLVYQTDSIFLNLQMGFYKYVKKRDKKDLHKLGSICDKNLPDLIIKLAEKKINNANDKDGIDAIQQSIKNYFLGEEMNLKKTEDLYLDYHLIGHQDPYFGTDLETNKTFEAMYILHSNIHSKEFIKTKNLIKDITLPTRGLSGSVYYDKSGRIITWLINNYDNDHEMGNIIIDLFTNILYDNLSVIPESEAREHMSRTRDINYLSDHIAPIFNLNLDIGDRDYVDRLKKGMFDVQSIQMKNIWRLITDKYNDIMLLKDSSVVENVPILPSYLNFNYNEYCPIDHLLNDGCCVKMIKDPALESLGININTKEVPPQPKPDSQPKPNLQNQTKNDNQLINNSKPKSKSSNEKISSVNENISTPEVEISIPVQKQLDLEDSNDNFINYSVDKKKYSKDENMYKGMIENMDKHVMDILSNINKNLKKEIANNEYLLDTNQIKNILLFFVNHPRFKSLCLKILLDLISETCHELSLYNAKFKINFKNMIYREFDLALMIFNNFTKLNYKDIIVEVDNLLNQLKLKKYYKQQGYIINFVVPILCNSIKEYITRLVYDNSLSELTKFINNNKCQNTYKIPVIKFKKEKREIPKPSITPEDKESIQDAIESHEQYKKLAELYINDYPTLRDGTIKVSNLQEVSDFEPEVIDRIQLFVDELSTKKGGYFKRKRTKKRRSFSKRSVKNNFFI